MVPEDRDVENQDREPSRQPLASIGRNRCRSMTRTIGLKPIANSTLT